ncbi:MAG: DNA methyltransferase [Candidatus Hodarchaeales archaeon]|jgi:site-specific DNA-methyltransferase (adenine-specific)
MTSPPEALQFDNQTIFIKSSEDMSELEDSSIDVIVTSPPYNVGKNYSSERGRYNDRRPHHEYLAFLKRVFLECYRVLRDDGVFFLNIGDSARDQGKSEDVVRSAAEAGFQRLQTAIWIKSIFGKGHYTPSGGSRRLNNLWEFVFILVKGKQYHFDPKSIGIPYADKSNIGRYSDVDLRDPGDLLFAPYVKTTGQTIKKGHEAPFPIGLAWNLIKLVPNAKRVLDPFAGTGSTLAAARQLGIEGVGYEIHPRPEIIKTTILFEFTPMRSPLLPQLERYAATITDLLEKATVELSPDQREKILASLPARTVKELEWACNDLAFPMPLRQSKKSAKKKSLLEHLESPEKED